jgi:HK97 family phage major capsid protein
MAMINELAPNTTENHQGRLAYVPDDLIPKVVTDAVFDKLQETSLVARLGRSIPVSYGETVIPTTTRRPEVGQVGTGTSNAQREGATKPLSGTAWGTRSFSPIKLATIVTASEEFARTNPQGLWTQLQDDLAFAIGRGIDLAVFHGKQPLTGGALAGIDTNNVLANTANLVNLTTYDEIYNELMDGYDLVSDEAEFDGWAVDTRFKTTLVRAGVAKDVNGNPLNATSIDLNNMRSSLLGFPVEYGKAVRGDLGLATDSGIQVIGGDFSTLRYGFADEVRYKISTEATLTDANGQTVNLWQTNQVAVLVEVTFGWVVGDLDNFVKFTYTGS